MYEASSLQDEDMVGSPARAGEAAGTETGCPDCDCTNKSQNATKMDFNSVWRFVWDIYAGFNIWEPNLFECHFCALSLPKPGGIIAP
jgi:hypothetical protein